MSLLITKITNGSLLFTKSIPANAVTKEEIQSAPNLSKGKFEILEFDTISDLKRIFESTDINQSYCYGYTDHSTRVVVSREVARANNATIPTHAVTRTLDWFHFSNEAGVLFIDYDVKGESEPDKPLLVLNKIFKIIPELEDAPALVKPSASSYIWDTEKSDWFIKDSGLHIYFLIEDQSKVPDIVDVLHAKFPQIDNAPKAAVSLDYHSIECNGKFEKRDSEWLILNRDANPVEISIQVDGENSTTASSTSTTLEQKQQVMVDWDTTEHCRHNILRNFAHGVLKDTGSIEVAIIATQGLMQGVPRNKRDQKWNEYWKDLPHLVKDDPVAMKAVEDPLQAIINMATKASDVEKINDMEVLVGGMLMEGSILTIFSLPETGKTQFSRHLIKLVLNNPKVNKAFYVDLDSPAKVAAEMTHLSIKECWHYLNFDLVQGQSKEQFINFCEQAANQDLTGTFFVFDTLKKFTDLMQKNSAKKFYSMLRAMVNKGATMLVLAHANKYRDRRSNDLIFEGVGDVRSDTDSLWVMERIKDKKRSKIIVTVLTDMEQNSFCKNRFSFEPFSFEINMSPILEERTVLIHDTFVDVREELAANKAAYASREEIIAFKAIMTENPGLNLNELTKEVKKRLERSMAGKVKGQNKLKDILHNNSARGVPVAVRPFYWISGANNAKFYKISEEFNWGNI